MKKDMYLYCVIFAVFYTLSHAYGAKVSVVLGNGTKQHNLSCENGEAIEIKRGLQIFGIHYSTCDYQNHSCQWLPEYRNQRFCSIGDHIKVAFSCDGQKSCNTNSPDDPGIRCCKANNDCENRLGYKIEYDCVPGLKKLDLNPNQKEFSISGKDIIIKAPFDNKRNCSCQVVTEPTGYFQHRYYFLAHTGNNIITNYTTVKGGKKFSFQRDGDALRIVKTVLSGSQENESILKVTCSCSYDVDHSKTATARSTSRPMLRSAVFTSTKSSVETQENSGDISVSEDVDHSTTARPTSRTKSAVFTSTQSSVETQENPGDITVSEEGNNVAMIIAVVGVGLLLVLILVLYLVKKRTARTTIQTTNSNSDGEAIRERATVPDDDGYIHLPENRNDNSGIIIRQEAINNVIVGGNYHHIVPAGSQLQNDFEGNYNHVVPVGSQPQNDFDDYNHIGDVRGNNSVADVGDYDHIGRCVPQAQGNDRDDRMRSQENKYKKEDVTYAAVNKKDNPGRPKSTKDESVVGYKAHAKGGNSTTEDVEYAVVKKDGARK